MRINSKQLLNFYRKQRSIENGATLAWDHCYDAFLIQSSASHLALNLSSYMASYGMFRGRSFLRQTNHSVHEKVVEIISTALRATDTPLSPFDQDYVDEVLGISSKVRDAYERRRKEMTRQFTSEDDLHSVTDTLVTKALLVGGGYTPAYDRFFKKSAQKFGLTQRFGRRSLSDLVEFCHEEKSALERCQNVMVTPRGNVYPLMRIIDLQFWLIGRDIN